MPASIIAAAQATWKFLRTGVPLWSALLATGLGAAGGFVTGQVILKAAFATEKVLIERQARQAERKAAEAVEITLRQRIDIAEGLQRTAEEQRTQALEALRATQAAEAKWAAQVRASRAAAAAAQKELESIRDDTAAASFDPSYRIVGPDRIGNLNRVLCFDEAGRARKGRDPACDRYREAAAGRAP